MHEFKIGEVVVKLDGKRSLHRIARVTKRFVELEDGSQWAADDLGQYPRKKRSGFRGPRLGFDIDWARRNRAMETLRSYGRCDYSTDQLEAAAEILSPGSTLKAPGGGS